MDIMSIAERSKRMSLIRSKWTKQEKKLHNFLKGNKVKHRMHPKLPGSPDILLPEKELAIFLHGCFWHKCPKCYREPQSRRNYWVPKIERNVRRDEKNKRLLRGQGLNTRTIWEHQIEEAPIKAVQKILK